MHPVALNTAIPAVPHPVEYCLLFQGERFRVPPRSLLAAAGLLFPRQTNFLLVTSTAITSFTLLPPNVTLGACKALSCSRTSKAESVWPHVRCMTLAIQAKPPIWHGSSATRERTFTRRLETGKAEPFGENPGEEYLRPFLPLAAPLPIS